MLCSSSRLIFHVETDGKENIVLQDFLEFGVSKKLEWLRHGREDEKIFQFNNMGAITYI